MRIKSLKNFLKLFGPVVALFILCEFAIYYLVLWSCHYPSLDNSSENALKVMFLADTHLLGSRQGHWFDKLRREWQMHRAFQTAMTYFKPELVVFLGDIFDEGKWCSENEFGYYVHRFKSLFYVDEESQVVKVVAGNHDMGFHYAVTPYLNQRFEEAFEVSSVGRFSLKGVQFVTVNSMAMEGDKCFLCKDAAKRLKDLAKELKCLKDKNKCEVDYDLELKEFSHPILLQHFPLYRKSDELCNEPDEAPPKEKLNTFREGWDCLSRQASETLLDIVKPRLILSGHTHHGCQVLHENYGPEISVSSFSWRNRNNPAFILAAITPKDYALAKCYLPEENSVIRLYTLGGICYFLYLLFTLRQGLQRSWNRYRHRHLS